MDPFDALMSHPSFSDVKREALESTAEDFRKSGNYITARLVELGDPCPENFDELLEIAIRNHVHLKTHMDQTMKEITPDTLESIIVFEIIENKILDQIAHHCAMGCALGWREVDPTKELIDRIYRKVEDEVELLGYVVGFPVE